MKRSRLLLGLGIGLLLLAPAAAAEPCPPQPTDDAFADEVCSVGLLTLCHSARLTEDYLSCQLCFLREVPDHLGRFVDELYRYALCTWTGACEARSA